MYNLTDHTSLEENTNNIITGLLKIGQSLGSIFTIKETLEILGEDDEDNSEKEEE